jgi:hypothetical protein
MEEVKENSNEKVEETISDALKENKVEDATKIKIVPRDRSVAAPGDEVPPIDLDKIDDLDAAKTLITDLRDKLVASRKDIRTNLGRAEIMFDALKMRTEQLTVARAEADNLIRRILEPAEGGDATVTVDKETLRAIIKVTDARAEQHKETTEKFTQFLFDTLLQSKNQIQDVYSNFGREMHRPVLEMKKYISDSQTVDKLLIPLVRLPNYRDRSFGCSKGKVYMDLTHPELPADQQNEDDVFDINNYEFGINIKLGTDEKGFPLKPNKFIVTPEWKKGFRPDCLVFTVDSIEELVPAIDFCIANIESEIIKFLHQEEDAKKQAKTEEAK